MAAQDGQRTSDREPQALRMTPSGSEKLDKVTVFSPVGFETTNPRSRMGWLHQPRRSPRPRKSSI
jgi:hypothetical protein